MIKTSDSYAVIAEALAQAQKAFPAIPKNKEAEVKSKEGRILYKFKYADLVQIIESTREALTANKIGFTQGFIKTPDGWCLATRLMLGSEWIESGYVPVWFSGNDMKTVAATLTYAKRYSLQSALGVCADEDVDLPPEGGNTTTITEPKPRARNAAPGALNAAPGTTAFADKTDLDRMMESYSKLGVSARAVCRRYGLEDLSKMNIDQLEDARDVGRSIVARQSKVSDHFKE